MNDTLELILRQLIAITCVLISIVCLCTFLYDILLFAIAGIVFLILSIYQTLRIMLYLRTANRNKDL